RRCYVPAFGQELRDGTLLLALLYPQFIVEEMIGKRFCAAIDVIDADAVAIAIGADHTRLQIGVSCLLDGCFSFHSDYLFDDEKCFEVAKSTGRFGCLFCQNFADCACETTPYPSSS